jgi:hypothetical protein
VTRVAPKRVGFWIGWGSILALGVIGSVLAPAQKGNVSSEKKTSPELGQIPTGVLKVEKLKGVVKSVDLEKRSVTITHSGKDSGNGSTFEFPTAAGREKISISPKVARASGKRAFRLEDLKPGSEVRVQYYPALGTIMEIMVEDQPK